MERMNRGEELADNLSSIRAPAIVIPSSLSNVTRLSYAWGVVDFKVTVTELQPDHVLCNLVLICTVITFGNSPFYSPCFPSPSFLLNTVVGSLLAKKSSLEVWQTDAGRCFCPPSHFPLSLLLSILPSHLINLCPTSGPLPTWGYLRGRTEQMSRQLT